MKPTVRFVPVASVVEKNNHIVTEAQKMVSLQHRVLIWVKDREQAKVLDEMLWSHPSSLFLPHAVWPCALKLHPVILSWQPLVLPFTSHLIVAHPHPPLHPTLSEESTEYVRLRAWSQTFKTVLEFVDTYEPTLQQHSRNRFRFWKEQHCSPVYEAV